MRSQLPENIFARLTQVRADFALGLLQKLVEAKPASNEHRTILPIVWETIRTLGNEVGFASSAEDAAYYRTLLKILFLALRANTPGPSEATDFTRSTVDRSQTLTLNTRIVLEIIETVIGRGFHELAVAIHENPAEASPGDIALLTAILQACIRMPGIEFAHTQIVDKLTACNTSRTATTLFSWADKLAVDGDPIYGELSILFLLGLSSMPAMAEQLAIEGILGHVSTANITAYIRAATKVSPIADSAGKQRCYGIWVRGILPLLLNLLDAVGASIAAEVALFLSQFSNMLEQNPRLLDAPDSNRSVTSIPPQPVISSTVSEAHSLALLTYILSGFRQEGAGSSDIQEITWDGAGVLEDVEFWLSSRPLLRERIMPMGAKEVEMLRQEPLHVGLGCQNRLEETIVEGLMGVKGILTFGDA